MKLWALVLIGSLLSYLPSLAAADSRVILSEQLKPLILSQTGGDDVTVLIDPTFSISANQKVVVESLEVDPQRQTFSAYVNVGDTVQQAKGKYSLLVPVPVLIEPIKRETIVSKSNVDYIRIPERSLNNRVISSIEDLEGMEAKRSLRAGRPIRTTDVRSPRLVKKGERVVLQVKNPFMQLTAEGKALEHGGKGDVVRILNVDSKQTVTGTVIAPNLVNVQ